MKGILVFISAFVLFSCNSTAKKGMFTVNGELKGAADQKVYLEQISFNQQPPQILDTAEVIERQF